MSRSTRRSQVYLLEPPKENIKNFILLPDLDKPPTELGGRGLWQLLWLISGQDCKLNIKKENHGKYIFFLQLGSSYYFFCSYSPVRPHELPWARIITPFLNYLTLPVKPGARSVSQKQKHSTLHSASYWCVCNFMCSYREKWRQETVFTACLPWAWHFPWGMSFNLHNNLVWYCHLSIWKIGLTRSINSSKVIHLRSK